MPSLCVSLASWICRVAPARLPLVLGTIAKADPRRNKLWKRRFTLSSRVSDSLVSAAFGDSPTPPPLFPIPQLTPHTLGVSSLVHWLLEILMAAPHLAWKYTLPSAQMQGPAQPKWWWMVVDNKGNWSPVSLLGSTWFLVHKRKRWEEESWHYYLNLEQQVMAPCLWSVTCTVRHLDLPDSCLHTQVIYLGFLWVASLA